MRMNWSVVLLILLFIFMQTGAVLAVDQTNSNQAPSNSLQFPKLAITNLTFSQVGLTTKGSFDVENKDGFYAGKLNYSTSVYKAVYDGTNSITSELVNNTFNPLIIYPKEKETVSFVHNLPDNISSGTYRMTVMISNSTGKLLGTASKDMGAIQGNNIYLDSLISSNAVSDKLQGKYISLKTNSYAVNESPTKDITYINSREQACSAYPQITVYDRNCTYKSQPIKTLKGDKIDFQAKEQKKVELKLPGMEKPDLYSALVVMLDESGKQISGVCQFTYIVKGENAKIMNVQAVPNTDNGKLDISALISGPMDGTEIKGAAVVINVYADGTNELISQISKTLDLGVSYQAINLQTDLDKVARDIRVETSIKYQDKMLDTNILKVPSVVMLEEKPRPTDVVGSVYEYSVGKLIDLGIISGYPDGTFRPDKNITRAEFVKIICMLLDKQAELDKSTGVTKFNDVKKNHWAGKYIDVAAANDIVKGYPGGNFKPEDNVTYAEAVTLIVRLLGYQKEMDEQGGIWPDNYISKGCELGMTAGINMDKPTLAANRGDIALLVWNTYKEVKTWKNILGRD